MNVLYIDFNILVYPSIKLYKNFFDEKASIDEVWNYLNITMNMSDFISLDANTVKLVAKILKKYTGADKCVFLRDYSEFISKFENLRLLKQEDQIDLTYISFFDHFWDSKQSKNDLTVFSKYNYKSFIGYIYMNKMCNSITWGKAPNSDILKEEFMGGVYFVSMTSSDILDKTFDMIYLYNSPFFLPYKYQYIYDTFEIVFGEN